MTSKWLADELVKVPSRNVNTYKRNFLKQVVYEFRFPILMELGDAKPPEALVNALRRDYPYLESIEEKTLSTSSNFIGSNYVHILRSADRASSVSIKHSSLSIETTSYVEFTHMKAQVMHVINASIGVLDTDFFTRVGLRYINVIDREEDPAHGWVNDPLVAPLQFDSFSGIHEFAGKLSLTAADGGCLLQHGIKFPGEGDSSREFPHYFIDIDSYRYQIAFNEIDDALVAMHDQAFNVFDWSIGKLARDFLTNETLS